MAVLPTRSFATIVSNIAAGMQGRLSVFLNFATGSVLRAIAEAYAGVLLWLQGIALEVAKLTRLSTSFGSDADSFVADYGIVQRIGSVPATGLCIFSRYTPSSAIPVIQVGATVQTQDGTQAFAVYADPTNSAFSLTAGGTVLAPIAGYVMPAQVTSLNVPVRSITPSPNGTFLNGVQLPGANGNVAAGAISVITSAIAGVDAVINDAPFSNGSDQETDAALKVRFRLAIASLSKGTDSAYENAIAALQTGLEVTVQENVDYDGAVDYGMVTVVVDDGSGNLPGTTLAECENAIAAVRAASVRVGVYAATPIYANVVMTIVVATSFDYQTVVAQVSGAVALAINGLGLGNPLPYFDVAAWALAVPGCQKVSSLQLNGGMADLAATPLTTIKTQNVDVS